MDLTIDIPEGTYSVHEESGTAVVTYGGFVYRFRSTSRVAHYPLVVQKLFGTHYITGREGTPVRRSQPTVAELAPLLVQH